MHRRFAALVVVVYFCCPSQALPQSLSAPAPATAVAGGADTPQDWRATPRTPLFDAARKQTSTADKGFWAPFKEVPDDFVRFLSVDTARFVGIGAVAAFAAHPLDDNRLVEPSPSGAAYKAGNIGGSFLTQAGLSFATYSIGRLSGSEKISSFGADLVRAQILSQGLVQAGKLMTSRSRPDGSNDHSLPSGHTASAFATAAVIQRHFGWKAGIPAYAFGAYVASSRMAESKHYLSDVLMGAAIGIAAGRTVTMGVGGMKFDMGVAPTAGGAAITFTKR